ncbi:MAG: potassium-transporting ATPase subunit KdpA [Candidatus Eremiobacteraeota bacterium]|nr:potassium-transporting ATPase subunit KdpA [Candidatus Eremiobacteraeota bacterium]MBV9700924.1 potassium-transporting ATPase subunit KdpA [Candidatus Eremiobacteraeota bacterium]
MTGFGWLQAVIFFAIVLAVTKPLGTYMARVFEGERTWLTPVLAPLEKVIYRLCGVRDAEEMSWYAYALSMLAFSLIGLAYLYVLLRTQKWLPFNPQHVDNMSPDLAWNTAVSFTTNTNWQFYSGETAMSYLSQMAGLAWHNFVSAAVGIAIAVAVVRGLVRTNVKTLGNFWVDLTRCSLYVLLPTSIVLGLFLVWQGVPQNLHAYQAVHSIEGFAQTITGGPMGSQEVIKELGTNGGGFVNANSASPNENPTPLTNFVEMLLIFSLGAGLTYMYGKMVKDTRQGWAIFSAMAILFVAGFAVAYWAEAAGNPIVHQIGAAGGNLEGKECRFGVAASAFFATVTTDTSCGAVNSMHDSFTALGGLVPLVNMQLGEIVFGGVGSGLYGMIVFVVLTVFIAGLMVGRTPEYLGKKVERREVQFAILAALVTPVLCLVPTAIAAVLPAGLATLGNNGPHGFSEILYGFTSTNANNGSAFAGLGPNLFYNLLTGVNMMFGRFAVAIPALALAGALAGKKAIPESSGTFTTHSAIFVALLIGVIVIVGALTFLPADSLGPIVEHLLMLRGKLF